MSDLNYGRLICWRPPSAPGLRSWKPPKAPGGTVSSVGCQRPSSGVSCHRPVCATSGMPSLNKGKNSCLNLAFDSPFEG